MKVGSTLLMSVAAVSSVQKQSFRPAVGQTIFQEGAAVVYSVLRHAVSYFLLHFMHLNILYLLQCLVKLLVIKASLVSSLLSILGAHTTSALRGTQTMGSPGVLPRWMLLGMLWIMPVVIV